MKPAEILDKCETKFKFGYEACETTINNKKNPVDKRIEYSKCLEFARKRYVMCDKLNSCDQRLTEGKNICDTRFMKQASVSRKRTRRTRYMKMDSCFAVALDAHWTCKDEVKSAHSRVSQCFDSVE